METNANLVKRNEEGQAITNSLLVAQKFEKDHKHVLDVIRNLIAENSAAKSYYIESVYESRGKSYPMYVMNRDGFTLLVMGFTGEKAFRFKIEYLEAFNKMEALLNSDDFILMRGFQIMDKKVKTLEADNAKKDEIIELQHETINELAPKAEYTEKVLISKDTFTATQIAKEFGMGAISLNSRLRELRIQYKHGGQWLLYAKYQNKGYTKTHTYTEDIGGETRTWHSTVWTEKGRRFIHDCLNKHTSLRSA